MVGYEKRPFDTSKAKEKKPEGKTWHGKHSTWKEKNQTIKFGFVISRSRSKLEIGNKKNSWVPTGTMKPGRWADCVVATPIMEATITGQRWEGVRERKGKTMWTRYSELLATRMSRKEFAYPSFFEFSRSMYGGGGGAMGPDRSSARTISNARTRSSNTWLAGRSTTTVTLPKKKSTMRMIKKYTSTNNW